MGSSGIIEMSIDKLEKEQGISRYKAVLMAAQQARELTDRSKLELTDLDGEKATTVALKRLFEGKIVEVSEENE